MAETDRQAHGGDRNSIGTRFSPAGFQERFDKFASLDPHFADLWATYGTGLLGRGQLDVRTRLLTLAGQYTMRENGPYLAEVIEAAISAELDLREVLEAILQCYVYGGEAPVDAAVDVFLDVVGRAGLLDEVKRRGLPVDATTANRSLEDEQGRWAPEDVGDPRMERLLGTYDWRGISDAVRLRPGSTINNIDLIDALDPDYLELWLKVVWGGMYARGVLDDKTRILCIVADCFAVGDTFQYTRHMQGALRAGAHPRELLELVFQSCHVLGHPMMLGLALNDLLRLLDELGRLDEVVDDVGRLSDVRRLRDARIAMRSTVADLTTADVGLDGR